MVAEVVNLPKFTHRSVHITDLKPNGYHNERGKFTVDNFEIDNERFQPSQRFWGSVCSKYGISPSIFKYFDHSEVFARISERVKAKNKDSQQDMLSLTIQDTPSIHSHATGSWTPTLLGVGSSKRDTISGCMVPDLMNSLKARDVAYREGIVISEHDLHTPFTWDVGPDTHHARIVLETPIDGYGSPNLLLMLERDACTNTVLANNRIFRSSINVGKNAACETVFRAVQSFSNEEGFIALRDRLLAAQQSWASIFEAVSLSKVIQRFQYTDFDPMFIMRMMENEDVSDNKLRNSALKHLYKRTGNLREMYGLATLETISEKQMRQVPTKATVYDLICFASELGTHQLTPGASSALQRYVGQLLGHEVFDLEGSCEEFKKFDDFIDKNSKAA